MGKIHLAEADISRAKNIFKMLKGVSLPDKSLLSKGELKALERKGIIEKIPTYGRRKYSDITPPMRYVWRWKNMEELGIAPQPDSENKG